MKYLTTSRSCSRSSLLRPSSQFRDVLTDREWEVLDLLAQGRQYKEIADELDISVNTVNNHLANIRSRLGVHNAVEAIIKVNISPRTA